MERAFVEVVVGSHVGTFLVGCFTDEDWQVASTFAPDTSMLWRAGLAPEHVLVVDLKTAETVLAPRRSLMDAAGAHRSAPLTALLRWLAFGGSSVRRMPRRLELPLAEVRE